MWYENQKKKKLFYSIYEITRLLILMQQSVSNILLCWLVGGARSNCFIHTSVVHQINLKGHEVNKAVRKKSCFSWIFAFLCEILNKNGCPLPPKNGKGSLQQPLILAHFAMKIINSIKPPIMAKKCTTAASNAPYVGPLVDTIWQPDMVS